MDREDYLRTLEEAGKLATAFLNDMEATLEEFHFHQFPRYQRRIAEKYSKLLGEKVEELSSADPPADLESLYQGLTQAFSHLLESCQAFSRPCPPQEYILCLRGAHAGLCSARRHLYQLRVQVPGLAGYWVTEDELANLARIEVGPDPSLDVPVGLLYRDWTPGSPRYTLYVPEYYCPERNWPLIVALHGGSGNDNDFVWLWLKQAKSKGYLLVAPKSKEFTWTFSDIDIIVASIQEVRSLYRINEKGIFLTGVSDGGTFTYEFGLANPHIFAAIAPVCGALIPWPWQDFDRAKRIPVYILHGALDPIIPVGFGRQARKILEEHGYEVVYREPPDWGHSRPYSKIGGICAFFGEILRRTAGRLSE